MPRHIVGLCRQLTRTQMVVLGAQGQAGAGDQFRHDTSFFSEVLVRNAGGMETTTAPRARTGVRTPAATLVLICTGYFMVILDATVTNVALRAIGRGLHGGITGLQWVVDAYTLAFAALLLTGGALAE